MMLWWYCSMSSWWWSSWGKDTFTACRKAINLDGNSASRTNKGKGDTRLNVRALRILLAASPSEYLRSFNPFFNALFLWDWRVCVGAWSEPNEQSSLSVHSACKRELSGLVRTDRVVRFRRPTVFFSVGRDLKFIWATRVDFPCWLLTSTESGENSDFFCLRLLYKFSLGCRIKSRICIILELNWI